MDRSVALFLSQIKLGDFLKEVIEILKCKKLFYFILL
jgi:hypothetical protein